LQADWSTLPEPVDLTGTTDFSFTLDVFWGSPRTVLAGLTSPRPGSVLGLYRTHNEGGTWDIVEYAAGALEGPYNPFVPSPSSESTCSRRGPAKAWPSPDQKANSKARSPSCKTSIAQAGS
jgi:hypothetical protein